MAWSYMEQCAAAVIEPGFLVNPWGRVRHFPYTTDRIALAGMQRQGQNQNIQSTVADTTMLAMQLCTQYRQKHKMQCKMLIQVHDALVFALPKSEIEQTKEMLQLTMGSIDIPMPSGKPLRLGIDIEVMERWGAKD